jgi:periplasmic divalent cation tolerance protein
MPPVKLIAVFTTTDKAEEARALAKAMVERKLAACAQVSEIESVYEWKGAVQNEKEFRILFKTTEARYEAIERAIREMHSYELPAIYALPVERAFAPYAAWVEENSTNS